MLVAIVGMYPPTRSGIATFTADVEQALGVNGVKTCVVAVGGGAHPGISIDRDDVDSYERAARTVNALGCDVALIQHELGIFGGRAGDHILAFCSALAMPYVVTMHSVLPRFSDDESRVVRELCRGAAAVTVFTASARRLLLEHDLASRQGLHVVAHGAPPELYADIDPVAARRRLGVPQGVPVMSSFGLLSEEKGFELGVQAMALLRSEHPDLHYVIAGRTHPDVVARDGERYRYYLNAVVDELGLRDRVIFLDRFLELDELAALLGISDVVCTPNRGEDQTVSGVLTFALAAARPVASTPFRYARDMLVNGAGVLADFGDDEGLANAIHTLLDGSSAARARAAARHASARMAWPTVGAALVEVLDAATANARPSIGAEPVRFDPRQPAPRPGTAHLRMLCDDTAVLHRAHHNMARLEEGYRVDDAARALPIAARLAQETNDDGWYATTGRLMAFVRAAALDGHDTGRMHNVMSWDRRWLDEPHTGDHLGRAMWGLGEVIAGEGPFAADARELLDSLAVALSPEWPARSLAYAALGIVAAASTGDDARDDDLERILPALRLWVPSRDRHWKWCEPRLTHDNARLPEVLLRVGAHIGDQALLDHGTTLLTWLDTVCRLGEHYRFVGHRGLSDAERLNTSGDEHPIEAAAMADAHLAWLQISGDADSHEAVERAWTWFLGNNRLAEPVGELSTGASYDALGSRGVNANRGAEATIAFHRCSMTRTAAQPLHALEPAALNLVVETQSESSDPVERARRVQAVRPELPGLA